MNKYESVIFSWLTAHLFTVGGCCPLKSIKHEAEWIQSVDHELILTDNKHYCQDHQTKNSLEDLHLFCVAQTSEDSYYPQLNFKKYFYTKQQRWILSSIITENMKTIRTTGQTGSNEDKHQQRATGQQLTVCLRKVLVWNSWYHPLTGHS